MDALARRWLLTTPAQATPENDWIGQNGVMLNLQLREPNDDAHADTCRVSGYTSDTASRRTRFMLEAQWEFHGQAN